MSLSEKSDATSAQAAAAEGGKSRKSGANLIERWDALQKTKTPAADKAAADAAPRAQTSPAAGRPPAPGTQPAKNDRPASSTAPSATNAPAPEKRAAAEPADTNAAPTAGADDKTEQKAGKKSYTKVNFQMNFGSSSGSGRSARSNSASATATQNKDPSSATAAAATAASAGPSPTDNDSKATKAGSGRTDEHGDSAIDPDSYLEDIVLGDEARAGDRPSVTNDQADDKVTALAPDTAVAPASNDPSGGEMVRRGEHGGPLTETGQDAAAAATVGGPPAAEDDMAYAHYGRSIFLGMLLLIVGLGGFITWASLAPLSTGVLAPGSIKLQGERKTVQHLEGGIIKELLVSEGDAVREGQVLVRLDSSKAEAVLEVQSNEYYALLARRSRLESERRRLDAVVFDPELVSHADDPDVAELMAAEETLFSDRKANLEDQLKMFESTIEVYKREISGLEAQRVAARKQLVHIKDELDSVETLYKKGIIAKPRLLELKRTAAGLDGQIGSLTADIARAEQQIGEAELRGVVLLKDRAEQVSTQLTDTENALRRIKEQLPAQRDVVERLEIKAPRSGRVVNLHYHTPGGVIGASAAIMDIVPEDEKLLVEAQVKPIDIDILQPGMEAQITLTAYSQRKTPPVSGRLLQVSADRLDDPKTGESHYLAMVEIDQDALHELKEVKLYPGMPAQVQFKAGERTPLDYLLAPIEAGLRNSWLEE